MYYANELFLSTTIMHLQLSIYRMGQKSKPAYCWNNFV